jgi:hypothetical protein
VKTLFCPVCRHASHLEHECVCGCLYHKTFAAAADRLSEAVIDFKREMIREWRKLWRR